MNKVDFDEYAENYDQILKDQLSFFSEDDKYFAKYKISLLAKHVPETPKRILEYGCGTGRNLAFIHEHFPDAEIFGGDISKQSVALAKEENPFAYCFSLEEEGPYPDHFDLVFVAGVFHHISPNERLSVMSNIYKQLKDGGVLFVFEHNPYNPITRKLVRECPFDADASLLAMSDMENLLKQANFEVKEKKFTLFIPPALKVFSVIENYLGWLPLGGQYFVQARKPSGS